MTYQELLELKNKRAEKVREGEGLLAKKDFDAVVQSVNGIINFYITGEEPGCTHNCSTCGESCGERTAPQDFRAPAPLQHIFRRGAVIHRQIAERRQRVPRIVAGIQGIAVKNNDFHGTAPIDVRLMFKGTKRIPDTFTL